MLPTHNFIFSRFCVLCTVLLFLSCKKDESFRSGKTSGFVEAQGITSYMYGSHVLKNRSGKTLFALRSSMINLDNYLHKKVKLKGDAVEGYPVDGGPIYIDVTGVTLK